MTARHYLAAAMAAIVMACVFLMPGNIRAATNAQDNDKALKNMRDKITATNKRARKYEQEANVITREITDLRRDLVTAARKIQQTESDVYEKEDHLDVLDRQERKLKLALLSRHDQMAKTLGAMQRLSRQPVGLVAYRPDKAINSLRTASLLKSLQPELKKRAIIIRQDMAEILIIRDQISKERHELTKLLTLLTSEQIEMNRLLAARRLKQKELRQATRQERRKLKQFAARAKTLQELIAKIEQETREREKAARAAAKRLADKPINRPSQKSGRKVVKSARLKLDSLPGGIVTFLKAKGTMPLPARGAIHQTFGSRTVEGQSSEGITIQTRPLATVVSPHEGRIVFAGKFRSYGQLLIISHGPEYHTLLAGMTRLDAEVGQWVLKGEPVGQMAKAPDSVKTAGGKTAQIRTGQNLYVELRRMGKPINPLPWIVASDRKVL